MRLQQPVPDQGCLPLQQLPLGCTVSAVASAEPAALIKTLSSAYEDRLSINGAADAAMTEHPGRHQLQHHIVVEELQRQGLLHVVLKLQKVSIHAQPRLLAAFNLYQKYCR
jgi:hypothetical protein